MKKVYEIVFYDGDGWYPAYYIIDTIESETAKIKSDEKLIDITERVKEMFHLGNDIPSSAIQENPFLLDEDGLVPLSKSLIEPVVSTG